MRYNQLVTVTERCAKYVQACGKRSILETKPVAKIKPKTLSYIPNQKGSVNTDTFTRCTANENINIPEEFQPWKVFNRYILRPQIAKNISKDFLGKKQQLLAHFSPKGDATFYQQIQSTNNATELAKLIENMQTKLLLLGGTYKKQLIETTDKAKINKLRELYLKYYYEFTEVAIKIQKSLANKSTKPKAIAIEEQLQNYGFNFVAIGDDISQGKKLLKACEIWKKSGNKMPDNIIVSDTIPMTFASGQCLRDMNNETTILISTSSNKITTKGDRDDRLKTLLINWLKPKNKIPPKSTSSNYHVPIHEFSHSIQSQSIVEQRFCLPENYKTVASKVSQYGNASLEELYAELKTKSILKPNKMSQDEWNLLKCMENG